MDVVSTIHWPNQKSDHGTVDAMVKQFHRQRVPQHVGVTCFPDNEAHPATGDGEVLVEQILQAVAGSMPRRRLSERRVLGLAMVLPEPVALASHGGFLA